MEGAGTRCLKYLKNFITPIVRDLTDCSHFLQGTSNKRIDVSRGI